MIHFGLDVGKFVRWIGGEYTGAHFDVQHTLEAVRAYIPEEDYNHLKQVLCDGCPAQFNFDEELSNKLTLIS
jgi:hypothetical protein